MRRGDVVGFPTRYGYTAYPKTFRRTLAGQFITFVDDNNRPCGAGWFPLALRSRHIEKFWS